MMLNIILVLIYLVAVLLIGWISGKRETPADFVIASRDVGLLRTSASVFAVLGGEILIFQSALAYTLGFGAFLFWGGVAIGMICFAFAVPKIKSIGDKYGFINLSEYFGLKWGPSNRLFAAGIIFLTFFTLLVVQFMAVGNIVAPLLNISYTTVVLVAGAVVLGYLLLGGYKAVINTDFLQAILMIALLAGVVSFMDIGPINFAQSTSVPDSGLLISFLAIGALFIFSSADIWQRVFSARSVTVARNSFFVVAALFLVFGFLITLVGIGAFNHFPNIDPNQAFFWGLSGLLPPWLLGAAIVMVLATIMSTIDTEVYLLASTIAKDFSKGSSQTTDADLSKKIRVSMTILTVVATFIAIFVTDIIITLFALASLGLSLAPAIIVSLFWKLKPTAIFASMSGGVLAFVALIVLGQFNPDNAIATLPVALVFLLIGQAIFKDRELDFGSVEVSLNNH